MFEQQRNRKISQNHSSDSNLLTNIVQFVLCQRSIRHSLLCALTVWTAWLIILEPSRAIANAIEHWEFAFTMMFGSMVAGATSMGGGAVAFPALTKWLEVSPQDAKVFSLAIQSIGMSAASFTIVAMKTPVEWKLIRWVSLGGVFGIFLGTTFLAMMLPSEVIKISFTMIISSFALVLMILKQNKDRRNLKISSWGTRERFLCVSIGFLGGVISGLVGSGMDIFAYSVMVLLFGLCEKVSTPTSVILMAINAIAGFSIHNFVIGDFIAPVSNYWLAAIPVVVVGAPTGAILCNLMGRNLIIQILLTLIGIELITSLVLIPLTPLVVSSGLSTLILFTLFYFLMGFYRKKWEQEA